MRSRVVVIILVLGAVVWAAPPATAAEIGTVITRDTPWELSIAVSQHAFADRPVNDVVIAPQGSPDVAAVAAGLTSALPLGAPLLLVPAADSSDRAAALAAIDAEIERLTGTTDHREPPTIWLVGPVGDVGLDDFSDRRVLAGDAPAISAAVLRGPLTGGNESRVLLAPDDDPDALALAGTFGGAHAVAVLPVPDAGLTREQRAALTRADVGGFGAPSPLVDQAIVVGTVPTTGGPFATSVPVEGGDGPALSRAMLPLFATERPDGLDTTFPVHPVAASASGEPTVAVLASVVSAALRDDAKAGPLLLFDGPVPADLAAACGGGDETACAASTAAGPTTVIGLTAQAGTTPGAGPGAAVGGDDQGAGPGAGGSTSAGGDRTTLARTGGGTMPIAALALLGLATVGWAVAARGAGPNRGGGVGAPAGAALRRQPKSNKRSRTR